MVNSMIYDIKDSNGNVIGTLELPDSATQDQINNALSLYTYTPSTPTADEIAASQIADATNFGSNLVTQYIAQAVTLGLNQSNMAPSIIGYLQNLFNYLNNGMLQLAVNELKNLIADTSNNKTSFSPFVTNLILFNYLNQIQLYLSIPLTPYDGS